MIHSSRIYAFLGRLSNRSTASTVNMELLFGKEHKMNATWPFDKSDPRYLKPVTIIPFSVATNLTVLIGISEAYPLQARWLSLPAWLETLIRANMVFLLDNNAGRFEFILSRFLLKHRIRY